MDILGRKLFVIVAIVTVNARSCSGSDNNDPSSSKSPKKGSTTGITSTCDISDLECLDYRHAERPPFWENRKTLLSLPNFHGYNASEPTQVLPDGSVVIQNEVITAWGNWLEWKECPEGMYAVANDIFASGDALDYVGIFYLNFMCQTPNGSETDKIIDACAPKACPKNQPTTAGQEYEVCSGAIVGFSLMIAPPRRNGKDNVAADGLDVRCSTNVNRQVGALGRGINKYGWTKPVYCQKYQAMCGFQVQMQEYNANRDNSAMNNLRIKCCPVPDPLKDCVPTEEQTFIRTCDNGYSGEGLRCEFDSKVGLSVDYENEKALSFYFSIGYDFLSIKEQMKKKIISKLKHQNKAWDNISCNVERSETSSIKTICVRPYESVELYQIVGKCGYFWVRTNRFLKVINKNGVESNEYMHVN